MSRFISSSDKFKLIRLIEHLYKNDKLYHSMTCFYNPIEDIYRFEYIIGLSESCSLAEDGYKQYIQDGFLKIINYRNNNKENYIPYFVFSLDSKSLVENRYITVNKLRSPQSYFVNNLIDCIRAIDFINKGDGPFIEYIRHIYDKIR